MKSRRSNFLLFLKDRPPSLCVGISGDKVFLQSRQTPDMSSSCDVLLTPYVSYRPLEPRPWRFPSWLVTGSWHKWHYAPHRCSCDCSTRAHRTEYHLHGVIIGTVLRFSWSVSQARKQSRRRKRCLCARKGFQVMNNGHLKSMAELRFAFLTVNVKIAILCDPASCSVQKCCTFRISLLPLSSGLVNNFCQPDILTARHYIPNTISKVS